MMNAFRVSLNTTAVRLSQAVGRKNLVEFVERLGLNGIRPSCSIALGDTGITPLEHTAGYAVFANGGLRVDPFAVVEIRNAAGEVIYIHDRDAPEPQRVVDRRVAEQTNQLLQSVVEGGTGRRAQLEFTHAVGKTGTSSSYRDAWFVGFTGKYVTSVWLGNDDYRPMRRRGGGVTGGSYPAEAWQSFMQVAHRSMAFPTLPGLSEHPTQAAERIRLEHLRKSDPSLAAAAAAAARSGLALPDKTRAALEALQANLARAAAGEPAVTPSAPNTPPATDASDQRARAPAPTDSGRGRL